MNLDQPQFDPVRQLDPVDQYWASYEATSIGDLLAKGGAGKDWHVASQLFVRYARPYMGPIMLKCLASWAVTGAWALSTYFGNEQECPIEYNINLFREALWYVEQGDLNPELQLAKFGIAVSFGNLMDLSAEHINNLQKIGAIENGRPSQAAKLLFA